MNLASVERDLVGIGSGDTLPTYDDLATQSGPNSRFGRWRHWIEKRAAERYLDITPEERQRRRARGWGNEDEDLETDVLEYVEESEAQYPPAISVTAPPHPPSTPNHSSHPPHPHLHPQPELHIQTNTPAALDLSKSMPPTSSPSPSPSPSPLLFVTQALPPSHLRLKHFGSRFLPHTTTAIHCVLPLLGSRLLLIGHDEGLSVLDMFPLKSGYIRGPDEAQARQIWLGEGVFQMSILEVEESTGDGTPQGVVLMLVAPEPSSPSGKDQEGLKALRMYNLNSLISLARWTISQKGAQPLDLHRPSNWTAQQTSAKRHHHSQSSLISRSLKSLIDSSASSSIVTPLDPPPSSSSIAPPSSNSQWMQPPNAVPNTNSAGLQPPVSAPVMVKQQQRRQRQYPAGSESLSASSRWRQRSSLKPNRPDSDSSDSSWDVIDDLPLRWATDYVPFASAGSRLVNTSILSYTLWRNDEDQVGQRTRGGVLLGVAIKGGVLLYETPKGERAFRFVKEFYTPMVPRSITFVHGSTQDLTRNAADAGLAPNTPRFQSTRGRHGRSESVIQARGYEHRHTITHGRTLSQNHVPTQARTRRGSNLTASAPLLYGAHLSLFVTFEKKAGLIRLADSAAGEVELYEDSNTLIRYQSRDSLRVSSGSTRRSRRGSSDSERKGSWAPLTRVEIPVQPVEVGGPTSVPRTSAVHILTRGKTTHIVPCPLPAAVASHPPLRVLTWECAPAHVAPRVCMTESPFLQLVATGEAGVEVQEISLVSLDQDTGNGKGKGRAQEPVRAQEEDGRFAGFLCYGGHWDCPRYTPHYVQSLSNPLASSGSVESLDDDEMEAKMSREQGIYGWCQKDPGDWRVFWVGGRGELDEH